MAGSDLISCRCCGSGETHAPACGAPEFAVPDDAPVAPEGYEWRHEQLVSEGELTRWDPERGESFLAERFRCFVLVRSQRGEGWGSIADGRLPLPTDLAGPELPFRRAVDAY